MDLEAEISKIERQMKIDFTIISKNKIGTKWFWMKMPNFGLWLNSYKLYRNLNKIF